MDTVTSKTPIEHPTYLADIRFMFEPRDVRCMRRRDIDLRTYEGVRLNAQRIYFHVREGSMPPDPNRRWPEEQVETFYNWMRDGMPRGVARVFDISKQESTAARVRRNISELEPDGEEIEKLKVAFTVLMDRDPDHSESYFALAGLHWLPSPNVWCRHHENAYNPWHRAYLLHFEDALRSVEGCEDVTVPYWDIREQQIPEVFSAEPFARYTIPRRLVNLDGSRVYEPGTVTQRFGNAVILQRIAAYDIERHILEAWASSHWERFNGWSGGGGHTGIILAHDSGHAACGPTLANQDVAAFDPLFWFFHANWDRLWWRWQQSYSGVTVEDFRTLLGGDPFWLDDPVANRLEPFGTSAANMIDLSALDVDYLHPKGEMFPKPEAPRVSGFRATERFTIPDSSRVVVRVTGVDRLRIPGTFEIALWVDDTPIRRRVLFQSTTPKQCETCRRSALVDVEFGVALHEIDSGNLRVAIEMFRQDGSTERFPLSQAGEPTVDVVVPSAV